jgi:hypothetical protein
MIKTLYGARLCNLVDGIHVLKQPVASPSYTLKMKAVGSLKILVPTHQTTQCHISEAQNLNLDNIHATFY